MDVISRQAAIKEIIRVYEYEYPTASGVFDEFVTMIVPNVIKNLPAADLSEYSDKLWKTAYERGKAEVHPRTGKWIEKDDGWGDVYYECSCCKEAFMLIDGTPTDNNYYYCPNCGARMEGSDGEI